MSKNNIFFLLTCFLFLAIVYFNLDENSVLDSFGLSKNTNVSTSSKNLSAIKPDVYSTNLKPKKDREIIIGSNKLEKFPASFNLVVLRPVNLEPSMVSRSVNIKDVMDIHLEVDAKAEIPLANQYSFGIPAGQFIPYLSVAYKIIFHGDDSDFMKIESSEIISGNLMPMVAADGLHYGSNIKLKGAGYYSFSISISSPLQNGLVRHTDSTGAGSFWQKSIILKGRLHYTAGMFSLSS